LSRSVMKRSLFDRRKRTKNRLILAVKMKKKLFSVGFILLSLPAIVPLSGFCAGGNITMAVFDFKANGVSVSLARSVTELFLVNLVEAKEIRVVERTDIEKIISEHELMLSGLMEESDAIEAGKLLCANKVLIGSVNKFGERLLLTARVVDVEQGYTQHAEKAELDSEEDLIMEVNRISRRIVTRIAPAAEKKEPPDEDRPVALDNPSSLPDAIIEIVRSALSSINAEMDWEKDKEEKDEALFRKQESREETLFGPPEKDDGTSTDRRPYLQAAYAGFDLGYYFSPLYFSAYDLGVEPAFLLGGYGNIVFTGGFKVGLGGYAMVPFRSSGSDTLLFCFGGPLFGWELGSDDFQVSIDVLFGPGRYSIMNDYFIELMNEWYFAAFPKIRFSFRIIDWVHMNIHAGYLYTNSRQYSVSSFVVGVGFQTGWWNTKR
jgi:TolB-like protein